MLFLLRKIRNQLLMKNKYTTYLFYAIGEILLVVAGILIAFQLEEWRDNSEKREKEQKILAQIHNEFLENTEQFQWVKKDHENVFHSADWLLQQYPLNESEKSIDSIQFHFNKTFKVSTFDPSLAGIEALINTGTFDLITNDSLRNYLVGWRDVVKDYNEEEISSKNAFNDRYVNFFIDKIGIDQLTGQVPINNFDAINSIELKNLLIERRILSHFILLESNSVERFMKNIMRLTKSEKTSN